MLSEKFNPRREQIKEIEELKSTVSDFNRNLTEIKVSVQSPDTDP